MAVGVDSPAPCCPKGSHVALAAQSGACCGHEITLGVDGSGGGGGFRCYTSGAPTASRTAVLVFHDVFGMDSGNHKMVCDALAAQHYVIMPDFYDGWSIEPFYNAGKAGDGKKELARFNWAWCSPRVEAVLQHLSEIGIEKTGSIGFCWGAWGVAKACQDRRIHAGVWAHPSCQVGKELYEGESEQELAASAGTPTLILSTPQEKPLYSNGELASIFAAQGVPFDGVHFRDQAHGFMTRAAGFLGKSWTESGGMADGAAAVGQQRAIQLALGWYAKHLYD